MNVIKKWETEYKPAVSQHKNVPPKLIAEILGVSPQTYLNRLKLDVNNNRPVYPFARAIKNEYEYSYICQPGRFIAWYEGRAIEHQKDIDETA